MLPRGPTSWSFDNDVFTALGATGDWAAGDARFYAAPGAASGHDADDRLIYNSTTGALYYDADGNGLDGALHVATFTSPNAPPLAASDITII